MSDFNNETIKQEPIDSYKRVKYSMGLVLGVDEFYQEQMYFLEKNRLHNRALHGYGTVCGLKVSVRDNEGKTEVVVDPGIAVAPAGQEIRVPSVQCGDIKAWFERNQDEINKSFSKIETKNSASKEKILKAYVTLCYRECERDRVPVPGVPCRSPEESMVNSRIEDSFELKFSLTPPPKHEEEIVRLFGELLGRIEITPDSAKYATSSELEDVVRELLTDKSDNKKIFISPDESSQILRNIFRVFVTEVRPKVKGKDENCFSLDGDCVCLARLDMSVFQANGKISLKGGASAIKVVSEDRPFLLHTRLLQEWMLCGKPGMSKVSSRSFATLFTMEPGIIRAWVHCNELLDIPTSAISIEKNSNEVAVSDVEAIYGDINVFDIYLKNNDEYPINGDRITVIFNLEKIKVKRVPQRNLSDILPEMAHPYTDSDGKILKSYLIADIPSLENLSDVDILAPQDGDVLLRRNGKWTSDKLKHHQLDELGEDDHEQYLLANGKRKMGGDLNADNHLVINLNEAVNDGDAVRLKEAITIKTEAKGDLSGTYPAPSVVGLHGKEIDGIPNADGETLRWDKLQDKWKPERLSLPDLSDVNVENREIGDFLKWDGSKWIPEKNPAQVQASRYLPFATITPVSTLENSMLFEVWFNIDAPDNNAEIIKVMTSRKTFLQVFLETSDPDSNYFKEITIKSKKASKFRNVFEITLSEEDMDGYLLRFVFNLKEKVLQIKNKTDKMTILEYANKNGISFMGFDGKETVTIFVKGKLPER